MTWTVALSNEFPAGANADTLIVGLTDSETPRLTTALPLPDTARDVLHGWVTSVGLTPEKDTARKLPAPEALGVKNVVVVGLTTNEPTPHDLRYAAGVAARACGDVSGAVINLPAPTPGHVHAIIEGALLGFHSPKKTETPATRGKVLTVVSSHSDVSPDRAVMCAETTTWVRDLVTTPPNTLYPETLVEKVVEFAEGSGLEIEIWDEKRLDAEGFGGILGVGGGSVRPPRLVALRYSPASPAGHIALVGKGITFDSGGLSLKPANSMVGMKYDMTGAATVAGAVIAAAKLQAPVAITGWLCVAENMPSGSALRPNDVLTIRGGKTVEVLNTDAEGRLVMADGLARASEDFPDLIVDVATLTGAARIALGERYAAIMGDDPAVSVFRECAEVAGELVWPMPLARELRSLLDSDVADIANAKPGNSLGGSLLAALFLEEFVGPARGDEESAPRIPWAHLDIAGPASNSSGAFGYTPKGATGVLTRTLIHLLTTGDAHVRALAGQ